MSTHVSTGCPSVDDLLNGGLEPGTITQVYGEPGAGKTNLAVSTAVTIAVNGGTVLYIDTEGFPTNRLHQLLPTTDEDVSDRIQIFEAYNFDEQRAAVKDAEDKGENVDFIVLDSATGFYRLLRDDEDDGETLRDVARQLTTLLGVARRYDIPVLVTNQVYSDFETESANPLGGHTVGHWTSVIMQLEQRDSTCRRARLEKHHAARTGQEVLFQITNDGLESVDQDRDSDQDGAVSWSRA